MFVAVIEFHIVSDTTITVATILSAEMDLNHHPLQERRTLSSSTPSNKLQRHDPHSSIFQLRTASNVQHCLGTILKCLIVIQPLELSTHGSQFYI